MGILRQIEEEIKRQRKPEPSRGRKKQVRLQQCLCEELRGLEMKSEFL